MSVAPASADGATFVDLSMATAPTDMAMAPGDRASDLAGVHEPGKGRDFSVTKDLSTSESPNDLSMATNDLSMATGGSDLATTRPPDLAGAGPDGSGYTPPPPDDTPIAHAAPSSMAGATAIFGGQDILDVSTDQGGGVWAVTATKVYYRGPNGAVHSYDQSNGLARGQYTWNDTWFGFGPNATVSFSSVAGATSGQAVIGNIGTIADRMEVDPASGAVQRIDNMKVVVDPNASPTVQTEQQEQTRRIVATWRVVADLNGTFNGTAYLGGFHGFEAFHGLDGDCGCSQFEQHNHAFADWAEGGIAGGDVRALAISPDGDVWQGDRDVVALWPQRSLGPNTDFFQNTTAVVDVFPSVRDEVWGVGVDHSNGVYVASYGNGLAYLSPASHQPTSYWSRATTLPQNHLTDITVDASGEVWIATQQAGIARFNPASNSWTYYTTASGLVSNDVHRVYVDQYSGARAIYIATDNGITLFHP